MLMSRLLSALVLAPLVIGALYFGGWLLSILALVVAAVSYNEFCAMARHGGVRPFRILGGAVCLLLLAATFDPQTGKPPILLGTEAPAMVLAAGVLATLAYALFQPRSPRQLAVDWALTLAGILYVGWLLRYGLLLRALPDGGREWIFTALVATWAADTGAFFAGRAFGRHKLRPQVSPGKTWEGVLGGLGLTLAATLLLGTVALQLAVWQALLLGVVVTAAAVLGDLAESLLKRATGVKDSGALIPGHGGLLDRIDSLLFVLPAVFYFSKWLAG